MRALVEHVADDLSAGADQRQRARGRHAQVVQSLGRHKLCRGGRASRTSQSCFM